MARALIAWRQVPEGVDRREVSRALVRELAGAPLELVQRCARCGAEDHGPLRVVGRGPQVSVAYATSRTGAPTLAVAAVGAGPGAIGVDAEYTVDAVRERAGVGPVLGRAGADIRDWVRVEAALKADGRGLLVDVGSVRVSGFGRRWRARVPGRAAPVVGRDIAVAVGVLISLARTTP
ncbi:chemotaxis protein CheY [Microbacterium sp. SORGH_AS_0888]|uniref:chemotaxis protein CheY n=1 Tax=Microbacterium sp. SORGH_AS_0888 TaxID=3041791 RepID=UPI0027806BEB|nr:chemotaxis protein CheY [Microbacterium sp. SORGH_AS_0888]MDQ1131060.1 4'-phosphopantetheinyl transferase [Microbacterium sp. SORGH_AS_0888]